MRLRPETGPGSTKLFHDSITGLNNMHAATNHGYIVWKLPAEPPEHLDLGPQETRS